MVGPYKFIRESQARYFIVLYHLSYLSALRLNKARARTGDPNLTK